MTNDSCTNVPKPKARACGALVRDDCILMVQHREPKRTYWTLPGGAVEPGETPEEATAREFLEETHAKVRVVRLIRQHIHHGPNGPWDDYMFPVEAEDVAGSDDVRLGFDPEEAHLPVTDRTLTDVRWIPLTEMREDGQIREVIASI